VEHWIRAMTDPDPQLRKAAAMKLGNVGPADARAMPTLLDALRDADPGVRREVIVALLKFGPAANDALPTLAQMRVRDPDSKVRDYARRAVDKLEAGDMP
jgi:HEAT repeat protein